MDDAASAPVIRAVLFDFGGTLYDYATLERGDRECLVALARWSGVDAAEDAVRSAYRAAMRRVFQRYLPERFYFHRDLFRDAAVGMLESFGATADAHHLARYRDMVWHRHQRDLALRDGVVDTLTALRARSLHVGMVSNIDDDQLAHLVDAVALRPFFDSLLSSEAARACKPDPAIFAEALRRAGCAAEETLFIGDTLAQDVAGAKRAGMRAVLLWHRDDTRPSGAEVAPDHVIRRIPELLDLL